MLYFIQTLSLDLIRMRLYQLHPFLSIQVRGWDWIIAVTEVHVSVTMSGWVGNCIFSTFLELYLALVKVQYCSDCYSSKVCDIAHTCVCVCMWSYFVAIAAVVGTCNNECVQIAHTKGAVLGTDITCVFLCACMQCSCHVREYCPSFPVLWRSCDLRVSWCYLSVLFYFQLTR